MTPNELHAKAVKAAANSIGDDESYKATKTLDELNHHVCRIAITAYLATLREHGWKPTPREATQEMADAGRHEIAMVIDAGSFEIMARASHRAMHDAAPDITAPPSPDEPA